MRDSEAFEKNRMKNFSNRNCWVSEQIEKKSHVDTYLWDNSSSLSFLFIYLFDDQTHLIRCWYNWNPLYYLEEYTFHLQIPVILIFIFVGERTQLRETCLAPFSNRVKDELLFNQSMNERTRFVIVFLKYLAVINSWYDRANWEFIWHFNCQSSYETLKVIWKNDLWSLPWILITLPIDYLVKDNFDIDEFD